MLKTNYFPQSYYDEILSSVSEGYVGKTKYLLEAEKACNEIVEAVLSQNSIFINDISRHPAIGKLNRALEKQFGFREVDVTFTTSTDFNAFTPAPLSFMDAVNGMPVFERPDTDSGKFYDKKHSYFVYVEVFSGIITKAHLTGEELLAIILHEIGHNFDTSVMQSFVKVCTILLSASIVFLPVAMLPDIMRYGFYFKGKLNTFLSREFPQLTKLFRVYHEVDETLESLKYMFRIPGFFAMNPFLNLWKTGSEIFADSFPAYYGYGPAKASALIKFDYKDDRNIVIGNLKRFPIIGALIDLRQAYCSILSIFMDPHPEHMVRVKNIIKKLEGDLNNKDIDPKVKKHIERDLKLIKGMYEKALELKGYEERNMYFTWLLRNLNSFFGEHIDLRNTLMRALPHSQA